MDLTICLSFSNVMSSVLGALIGAISYSPVASDTSFLMMTFLPSNVSVTVLPGGTSWPSNHSDSRTQVPRSFSSSPSLGLGSSAAVRSPHARRAVKQTYERRSDLLVVMVVTPGVRGKSAASTPHVPADDTR